MTDFNIMTETIKNIRSTLIKERLLLFAGGIFGTVGSVLLVWLALSILAGIIILPVWSKIMLLAIAAIVSLYLFWRLSFSKLFIGNEKSTALKLEKKYPELKGRLIAALQFAKENEQNQFSGSLIIATLEQAVQKSKDLNYNKIISAYPVWMNIRNFALVSAAALLLLVIFPGLFTNSYNVYSKPTELVMPPLGYELSNYPGDAITIKYRDLDIGGILLGDQFPEKATVHYKYAGGTWQKNDIDLTKLNDYDAMFGDSLLFTTTLKQVRRSLDYYVRAGKVSSPIMHVEVVDRPRVTGIKSSIFYPEYTGLQPVVIDENDGNISAVFGSRVNFKISTNVPTKSAELIFDDSSVVSLKTDGLFAETTLRINKDRRYYMALRDNQGEENPDPIEYQISAIPDEYPVIAVIRPGIDINLNDEMMIPLMVSISDDYGFSSLVLKYQIVGARGAGEENIAALHFSDRIKTEGEVSFNWDVEPLGLMPSEYIKYHFEIADNDRISGPKISSTRLYIARLPSLEEIIAETESEYGENVDQAEKYLQQQKELSERLKNIVRKMEQERGKSDSKLNWQHQKELQEITEKDEELGEKIQETAQKLDEMIDKMQENRLASRELLEKLEEIQKLFEEVSTPEMKEARLKLIQALKNMDQKELEKSLKDFQMSQEDMMKRLERTISLLKKMKIEQKVNAMTEMAKEIVQKQEQMNEKTGESSESSLPKLAPQEDKVKEALDKLKEEADDLKKLVDEIPFLKAESAEKFMKSVKQCKAGQNMEKMSDQLSKKNKESSVAEGEQALSKLMKLLDQLQQEQGKMCSGGGGEAAKMIRDAIEDINYVSTDQERLINEAGMMRNQSEALRDIASEQMMLREMMQSLSRRIEDIGNESPFVAAELGNLMRNAANNMDLSIDKFVEKRGVEAQNFQKGAMNNLNRAALRMLDALEKQSKCDKGGSCDKPSQKMQSLCNKQNQLNMQTQQSCSNPNNMNQSPEAMRRLAAEQGAIHKSFNELQKEFGQSREVLGRLDAIADDMQKVADKMATGEVGEETIERQLKIYSRMLDATRTMQRKDFTDQRRAVSAEDILRMSPPSLTGNQLKGGLDIDDRLKQFLKEDYPPEYEEHIKAYFKALLEQIGNPNTQ